MEEETKKRLNEAVKDCLDQGKMEEATEAAKVLVEKDKADTEKKKVPIPIISGITAAITVIVTGIIETKGDFFSKAFNTAFMAVGRLFNSK